MSKTDELFQLIKSLDKAEKRHFKLIAGQNSRKGENNYILLFDALDSLSEYNEEKLIRKLKGKSFVSHLASTKYQLQQLILKSLRMLHAGKSTDAELRELLDQIEILYNRGLLKQCRKVIRKASKLSAARNRRLVQLELMKWESRLFFIERNKNFQADLNRLIQDESQLVETIQELSRLELLERKIVALAAVQPRMRTAKDKASYDEILEQLALVAPEPPQSFWPQNHFHMIHGLYSLVAGDYASAFSHFNTLIHLWEESPDLVASFPEKYLNLLNQFQSSCLMNLQHEAFLSTLKKMRNLESNSNFLEMQANTQSFLQEMLYYMNYGEFDKGVTLSAELESWLDTQSHKIPGPRVFTLYFNVAIFFFVNADFSKSNQWINRILNHEKIEARQDIQDSVRILQVIIHFQLEDWDLVDYLLRSTHRYFRDRRGTYSFELTLLEKLRQALDDPSQPFFHAALGVVAEQLRNTVQELQGRTPPAAQVILFWLESRARSMALNTLFQEKLAEKASGKDGKV